MSFDLDVSPTFQATVQITVPGKPSRPLKVTFKHMDAEAFDEFIKTMHLRTNSGNADLMVQSVEDLPQGMDTEGFLAQLFKKFLASPKDILNTYIAELTGSRTKN